MSDILLTPNYASRVAGSVPKRPLGIERNLTLDLVKRYDDVYSIVNFIESLAICQGVEAEGKIIIQVKRINYGNLGTSVTRTKNSIPNISLLFYLPYSFCFSSPKVLCTLRVTFHLSISSIFINWRVYVCFDWTETRRNLTWRTSVEAIGRKGNVPG